MSDVDGKSAEVAALRAECDRLRAENARLRSRLAPAEAEPLPAISRLLRDRIRTSDRVGDRTARVRRLQEKRCPLDNMADLTRQLSNLRDEVRRLLEDLLSSRRRAVA